ncbi:MAG TPA: Ni/Fe hydrogenase subunit alpha [Anaeromyxobacteraceae bacterium]|nr:Ni/Fe hydrogenase subunit alpha [Anaeromyxobacteraceae bacterium]
MKQIVIEPVTRIEGHAKITIQLGRSGEVEDARFHVTEFRGFEKFCEGRSFREMPVITSRICGICPVSHLIASAKACDALLSVDIPDPAKKLRRLMNLGQLLQSHALSFFHLSAPDLVLGMESDPKKRNLFGLLAAEPEIARDGIRLRKVGQEVIEVLGGKRIHPPWATAGGVATPLSEAGRAKIRASLPEALFLVGRTLGWFKRALEQHKDEERVYGNFPTLFMAMVGEGGALEHYDGKLRFVSAAGDIVADGIDPASYQEHIGEAVESYSYLKFPYYKPHGYPAGAYRVGPLARLNCCTHAGTPRADDELAEFRQLARGAVLSSFHYHTARLIEMLYAVEKIGELLEDPEILSDDVQASARRNRFEGVGALEAPRGTLFHHYKVKPGGIMTWANLLIATGQNNLAMNKAVAQIARRYVDGKKIEEGMLNRVEAGIRAFDPCLSCSTHAAGQMPLVLELRGPEGELFDRVERG